MRRIAPVLLFALAAGLAAPRAHAHARVDDPVSRDGKDNWKDPNAPCGLTTKNLNPAKTYQKGQQVTVKWTETINHPGCFLVDISSNNDSSFTQLANVKHTTVGATPRPYQTTVTLPANVTCTSCTIRLRQIMLLNDTDPCPPAQIQAGATYYSCADVKVLDPDAGVPPVTDAGQPVSDAGGGTSDSGGGGGGGGDSGGGGGNPSNPDGGTQDGDLTAGQGSIGCSTSSQRDAGTPWGLGIVLGVGVIAAVRRRRKAG
jgi:MYXO-CTERM domain-containing protein